MMYILFYHVLTTLMALTLEWHLCLILKISALYLLSLDFNGCTWLLRIISMCLHKINTYWIKHTQLNSRCTDSSPSALRLLAQGFQFFAQYNCLWFFLSEWQIDYIKPYNHFFFHCLWFLFYSLFACDLYRLSISNLSILQFYVWSCCILSLSSAHQL